MLAVPLLSGEGRGLLGGIGESAWLQDAQALSPESARSKDDASLSEVRSAASYVTQLGGICSSEYFQTFFGRFLP